MNCSECFFKLEFVRFVFSNAPRLWIYWLGDYSSCPIFNKTTVDNYFIYLSLLNDIDPCGLQAQMHQIGEIMAEHNVVTKVLCLVFKCIGDDSFLSL
jgi:hypothetical protein